MMLFPYSVSKEDIHSISPAHQETVSRNDAHHQTKDSTDNVHVITNNLEQNVRKIEEERQLLRALVQNSHSVPDQRKCRIRKHSISDVNKQFSNTQNNLSNKAVEGDDSPRTSLLQKPNM